MLLIAVDGKQELAAGQRDLEAQIRCALKSRGLHDIGYPGGNQDAQLFTNGSGQLWAAFAHLPAAHIPRRWNAFGVYSGDGRSQQITVEINIPTDEASGRIAGFFAKDADTGHVYLMHDGGIGGGKAGVGRGAFLAQSKSSLKRVTRSDGRIREGIIVGRVDTPDLPSRIWNFVQQVSEFKAAVRRGDFDNPRTRADLAEWDDFKDESPGRRQGRRRSKIDYITYHGDVVRALRDERQATCGADERVLNSRLIDLYVRCGSMLTEVYEVKTEIGRQSIYTAIGQLMTHGPVDAAGIKRILAIPPGELAADLKRSLSALGIVIRRFDITEGDTPCVTLT
jgi:hypothetical protein